jgi:hypothetical protein
VKFDVSTDPSMLKLLSAMESKKESEEYIEDVISASFWVRVLKKSPDSF